MYVSIFHHPSFCPAHRVHRISPFLSRVRFFEHQTIDSTRRARAGDDHLAHNIRVRNPRDHHRIAFLARDIRLVCRNYNR